MIRTRIAGDALPPTETAVRTPSWRRCEAMAARGFVSTAAPKELEGAVARLAGEPVADAAHGHDLERRHAGELLAQQAHLDVDRLAIAGELVTPHVFEQHVARVDAAWVREQIGQQVELARGELHVPAGEHDAACCSVDGEVADGVALRYRARFVGLGRRAPQHRVDASQDFADGERLGDVVIGAQLEPDDLVDLGVLGREHDDRHAAALAQGAAEIKAAHAREHQVEEDQVRTRGAGGAQARGPIRGFLDGEPGGDKVVLEHLADALVILHNEDAPGVAVSAGPCHPSSITCPDWRNTMSSATFVTRSEIRSRLCATRSSVTERSAPSVSTWPLPISLTRLSKTR